MKILINNWVDRTAAQRLTAIVNHFNLEEFEKIKLCIEEATIKAFRKAQCRLSASEEEISKLVCFIATDIVAAHLGGEPISVDCRMQFESEHGSVLGGVAFARFSLQKESHKLVPHTLTNERSLFASKIANLIADQFIKRNAIAVGVDAPGVVTEVLVGTGWERRVAPYPVKSGRKAMKWSSIEEMHNFFGPLIERDKYGLPMSAEVSDQESSDDLDAPI